MFDIKQTLLIAKFALNLRLDFTSLELKEMLKKF